jgi:hypothetical protein
MFNKVFNKNKKEKMSVQALAQSLDKLSLQRGLIDDPQLVFQFNRLAIQAIATNEYLPRFKPLAVFQIVNPEPIEFKTFSIRFSHEFNRYEIYESGCTSFPKYALLNWKFIKAKFNNSNPNDQNLKLINDYLDRFEALESPYKFAKIIFAHF